VLLTLLFVLMPVLGLGLGLVCVRVHESTSSTLCAVPCCAVLCCAVLCCAVLCCAMLQVKLVLERSAASMEGNLELLPPWYFKGREGITTWQVGSWAST
jgi:hypothetical protein